MMPPTTTGVTCRRPVLGSEKVHLGAMRATFVLVICVSVV